MRMLGTEKIQNLQVGGEEREGKERKKKPANLGRGVRGSQAEQKAGRVDVLVKRQLELSKCK